MNRWLPALLVPLLALPAACDSKAEGGQPVRPGATGPVELDGRPFQLHVPGSYRPETKAPLVVALHGFTSEAAQLESYFKLAAESERRGFLYAMPEGTKDRQGRRFWNATEACCDFSRSGTDDSAYLGRLLDRVAASYSVDPARVYFLGHSNGGFMSYRMACEHADRVTAIVSLAGMATHDPAQCKPARPVGILQIHGTDDRTILYEGGANAGRSYPSVDATLALWRGLNGCSDQADTSAAPMDLDTALAGPETTVTAYTAGCRDGSRVELWSIQAAGHVPALSPDFARTVTDFLLARSAPA